MGGRVLNIWRPYVQSSFWYSISSPAHCHRISPNECVTNLMTQKIFSPFSRLVFTFLASVLHQLLCLSQLSHQPPPNIHPSPQPVVSDPLTVPSLQPSQVASSSCTAPDTATTSPSANSYHSVAAASSSAVSNWHPGADGDNATPRADGDNATPSGLGNNNATPSGRHDSTSTDLPELPPCLAPPQLQPLPHPQPIRLTQLQPLPPQPVVSAPLLVPSLQLSHQPPPNSHPSTHPVVSAPLPVP